MFSNVSLPVRLMKLSHGRETRSVVTITCVRMYEYTSHVSLPIRTELNVGKQTVLFQFHNLKFDMCTIIFGVKSLSFGANYFFSLF